MLPPKQPRLPRLKSPFEKVAAKTHGCTHTPTHSHHRQIDTPITTTSTHPSQPVATSVAPWSRLCSIPTAVMKPQGNRSQGFANQLVLYEPARPTVSRLKLLLSTTIWSEPSPPPDVAYLKCKKEAGRDRLPGKPEPHFTQCTPSKVGVPTSSKPSIRLTNFSLSSTCTVPHNYPLM